ncbi:MULTISPECIES: hypothetical protein [unclassified Clostridioides]|uniref:hypothetical protein n=1 Tax=unclassified Clostridioides TaxID=2635829 RepID=UPI001D0CA44C
MRVNGNPVKLMTTKAQINVPAPSLGENNEEIYRSWLGFDSGKINDLKENGVI